MKAIRQFTRVLTVAIFGASLLFNGCDQNNNPVAAMSESIAENGFSSTPAGNGALHKESILVAEDMLEPDEDLEFKLESDAYKSEIKIKKGSRNSNTWMRWEKKGEKSNTYTLSPIDINMPAGIEMKYEVELNLPTGLSGNAVKLFQVIDGTPREVTDDFQIDFHAGSSGDPDELKVEATAYRTGEFFLGCYWEGQVLRLDGDYLVIASKFFKASRGGKISIGDGSSVVIPKNALPSDTTISLLVTLEPDANGGGLVKNFLYAPHGLVFNQPLQLRMSYKEFGGNDAVLWYYNDVTGQWQLETQGVTDAKKKYIILDVHHFSRYALVRG